MAEIGHVRGDITAEPIDAIVNAANSELRRGGGVCGAIFAAAGPGLDIACRTIGHCDPGDAVITPGFSLLARFIVHTVGPIWRGGNDGRARPAGVVLSPFASRWPRRPGLGRSRFPRSRRGSSGIRPKPPPRSRSRPCASTPAFCSSVSSRSTPRPTRSTRPCSTDPCRASATRCSCSTATRLGAGRRGTRARGAHHSCCRPPRSAPCRGSRRGSPRPPRCRSPRRSSASRCRTRTSCRTRTAASSQQAHTYVPSSWQSQYSPVNARSVPAFRATSNWAGVSRSRHSSSVWGSWSRGIPVMDPPFA